jgi:hypothetical protein
MEIGKCRGKRYILNTVCLTNSFLFFISLSLSPSLHCVLQHSPAKFRMERTNLGHNESKAHVLPVVLIREPFWWMQSMVRSRRG